MGKCTFAESTGIESEKPLSSGGLNSSDIRNALGALFQGDMGVLRPRAQSTPDMTIHVNPAALNSFFQQVWGTGDSPFTYAGGNTSSITAPSSLPRIDIVYLTAAGALAIVTGTEAVTPVADWESLPKDGLPICLIYCKTTMTAILDYEDKDTDTDQGYIYSDVRPFLNLGGGASLADMQTAQDNIALLAFRLAVQGSLTVQKMEDGIVDEYEDETGVDTGASTATYDASGDYYSNNQGDQTGSGTALSGGDGTGSNVIPTMTSNTNPSGVASANNVYNSREPWTSMQGSIVSPGWTSGAGAPSWIKYAFPSGTTKKVNGYRLGTSYPSEAPKAWKLQGSNNDTDWTDLDTQSAQTGWTDGAYRTFSFTNSTAYRYFRLYVTEGNNATYIRVDAFELLESASKDNAFDDSTSTYWRSSQTSGSISAAAYIGYDFGVGVTKALTGFTIKQHAANQAINSVKVQRSDNGSSWTDVATVAITADTSLQTKSFTNTTAARYWRLLANAETASGSWEVEEVGLTLSEDLELISESFEAEATPTEGRVCIFLEEVDSITLNTDLKAYVSRDDGTTWTQITLTNEGEYDSSKDILSGSVSVSSQPSDKTMRYKIITDNLKVVKVHGASLSWKE